MVLDSEPTKAAMRKQAYQDLTGGRTTKARQLAAQKLMRAVLKGAKLPAGDHVGLMEVYKEAYDRSEKLDSELRGSREKTERERLEIEERGLDSTHNVHMYGRGQGRRKKIRKANLNEHQARADSPKNAPQRFLYKKVKDPVKK
jgi:hypothetical protein